MPEKSIILVNRRDGLTREQFRGHYEQIHVPLALEWFGFAKYVRNHVVSEGASFDCLAEFWPHDPAQVGRAAQAAVDIFAEDDALFMRPERRAGLVDEAHLAGPPRIFDPPRTAKTIFLLTGSDPQALAAWARAEVDCGRALRITVDRPRPGAGNLGEIAIVHVWTGDRRVTAPPGATEGATVFASDTAEAVLTAARQTLKQQ